MPPKARKNNPLVTSTGDPISRVPLFSDRPWLATSVHDDPTHARAPKETITAIARKHTVEAVLTLVYHMRNSRDPSISMQAATELLNRGWGKAPQVVGLIEPNSANEPGKVPLSVEDKLRVLEMAACGESMPVSVQTPGPVPAEQAQDLEIMDPALE